MIKYAAIGLVIGLAVGFWQGNSYRAGVVARAAQEAQAEAQRQQTKVIERSAQAEQARDVEYRTITKEVVKYVTRPNRPDCSFDAERVRIKQSAIDAANRVGL
ncbi:i-spanin [Escherichia phage PaulFeyerabend]|uniref:I-spanin n=1 Tax=Escherichia phage PaulFeyerabend TaxID=2851979 RepID=A0AAE8B3A6_9CAUD|nr:i-spanin [Escherichia phage PaulFeyerabend]QXV83308.1 i-spanin [Escherichia phage PaulFeyerabend]